jgi:hypothetical protein
MIQTHWNRSNQQTMLPFWGHAHHTCRTYAACRCLLWHGLAITLPMVWYVKCTTSTIPSLTIQHSYCNICPEEVRSPQYNCSMALRTEYTLSKLDCRTLYCLASLPACPPSHFRVVIKASCIPFNTLLFIPLLYNNLLNNEALPSWRFWQYNWN